MKKMVRAFRILHVWVSWPEKYCWTLSLEAFLPFIAAEGLDVSHEQILALRVGYRVTSWIQFPHCKAAAAVDSIIYTPVIRI